MSDLKTIGCSNDPVLLSHLYSSKGAGVVEAQEVGVVEAQEVCEHATYTRGM